LYYKLKEVVKKNETLGIELFEINIETLFQDLLDNQNKLCHIMQKISAKGKGEGRIGAQHKHFGKGPLTI